MPLADIDSITPLGYWVLFVGLAVTVVFTVTAVALQVRGLVELWREERQVRQIERALGRR